MKTRENRLEMGRFKTLSANGRLIHCDRYAGVKASDLVRDEALI